jgi:hypothetical protein
MVVPVRDESLQECEKNLIFRRVVGLFLRAKNNPAEGGVVQLTVCVCFDA